jgi:hypothetical protein
MHECHVLLRHLVHANDDLADLIDSVDYSALARAMSPTMAVARRRLATTSSILALAMPAGVFLVWIFQGKRPGIGAAWLKDCTIGMGKSLSRQHE